MTCLKCHVSREDCTCGCPDCCRCATCRDKPAAARCLWILEPVSGLKRTVRTGSGK